MNKTLKQLSEIAAKANDLFYSKFENVDTLLGIMDKTLRAQGMKADAITIDCLALDKKIVMLIHDDKPGVVEVVLGNKNGDVFSSCQYTLSDISVAVLVGVMELNFIEQATK